MCFLSVLFFAVFWTGVLLEFGLPVKHFPIIDSEIFRFIKQKVILMIYWKENQSVRLKWFTHTGEVEIRVNSSC